MNTFNIIQNFFTKMPCQFCETLFKPDDVSLISQGDSYYLVDVTCHQCGERNGTAAVGVEQKDFPVDEAEQDAIIESLLEKAAEDRELMGLGEANQTSRRPRRRFKDPEFTETDRLRLAEFEPIKKDDVLNAHQFFQNLDQNWLKLIPEEIRERCTDSDTE